MFAELINSVTQTHCWPFQTSVTGYALLTCNNRNIDSTTMILRRLSFIAACYKSNSELNRANPYTPLIDPRLGCAS